MATRFAQPGITWRMWLRAGSKKPPGAAKARVTSGALLTALPPETALKVSTPQPSGRVAGEPNNFRPPLGLAPGQGSREAGPAPPAVGEPGDAGC